MDDAQVQWINQNVDLLVLPAQSNVDEFLGAGVRVPIEIVPFGVDTNIYKPYPKRDWPLFERVCWPGQMGAETDFIFLAAGYMQARKGIRESLEAFCAEFAPDDPVAFVVKNVPEAWGKAQDTLVEEMAAKGHKVGLCQDLFSEWQMARLLSSADCFVNCHRREGFGLMPLQAMACGTPSILTKYDGPMSYADETCAFLVQHCGLEPVETPRYGKKALWAKLDVDGIRKAMRQAYSEDLHHKAEAGIERARAFNWKRSAKTLAEAHERHIGPIKRRASHKPVTAGTLTIAMPVRNGADKLNEALRSLQIAKWEGAIETLVFDDASDADVAKVCSDWDVRRIRSGAWVGEGAGRDVLLQEATGEYIFITDGDIELTQPDCFLKLKAFHEGHGGIIHPLVLRPDGKVWSAGGCYHDYAGIGILPGWHRCAEWAETEKINAVQLHYAPTVAWFTRTEDLRRIAFWYGGYFPTIFADVDMAFWAKCHGLDFWLCPEARLVHHAGSYTKAQDVAVQAERFECHAKEVKSHWDDRIEHDLAVNPDVR
jgi:GT2 family glycosyltransferase